MKKIISLCSVLMLVLSLSVPVFAADDVFSTQNTQFSFINNFGETVTLVISGSSNSAVSKVYVNGILTQKAIANTSTKTISTEIYDLSEGKRTTNLVESAMGDYTVSTIHMPVSNESIEIPNMSNQARSIYNEPVDNTGLTRSAYNDGYYFLGSHGGYTYAPSIYGYLYRTYARYYEGETKYWSWGAGDTLGAISVYISLFGGPVSAIISILIFTASEVLAYDQAIELATYTYMYHYRVRVMGEIHFSAERNITYWRIDNVQTNVTKWEEKSFNYGFSMANTEMVKFGIDNYLASLNQ